MITRRLSASGTDTPTGDWDTHPRTRASQESIDHHQRNMAEMKRLVTRGAQAACDFSFSASKFSPFFHRVSDGCNLACQRQPHPGRLEALGQRSLVKILEWSGLHTGPSGGSFEQSFQIMVVILVQAANRHLLFGAPQLAVDEAIFPAVAGAELALAAKTGSAPPLRRSESAPARESAVAWR
jgi:hypothetical protein